LAYAVVNEAGGRVAKGKIEAAPFLVAEILPSMPSEKTLGRVD
jgi:hypothetical protein